MMSGSPPSDVTAILEAIRAGNKDALNQLGELVYQELREMAAGLMHGEKGGHTLEPTALVNEAFLRLVTQGALNEARNRALFFNAAARAMRQVLVDHARQRGAAKRGGGWQRVPLDDVLDSFEAQHADVLALHEALSRLARLNERQSQVIELRYFGGNTVEQIADQLEVSVGTVELDLRKARAFLYGQLGKGA
jgi:RNA polymerase sigma factor (TIGR02999 family)